MIKQGLTTTSRHPYIYHKVCDYLKRCSLGCVLVQCNLDYPDLAYPVPRLSELSPAQQVYLCACVEGMTFVFSGCGHY